MAKIPTMKKKDKDKGSLNMGITALLYNTLLLINSLLRNNFLLIKQDTILHIFERVKETQVKVLSEEPSLPDNLC